MRAAIDHLPRAVFEKPYDGAKEMLLVGNVDDREFLNRLFKVMYDDLPVKEKKKTTV